MREPIFNSPQKFIHKLLMRAYKPGKQATATNFHRVSGRSPLDVPGRAVFLTFVAAVILALIIGNIFIFLLHKSIGCESELFCDLVKIEQEDALPNYAKNNIATAMVDLLWTQQSSRLNEKENTAIRDSLNQHFSKGKISVSAIAKFVGISDKTDSLKNLIIGDLNRSWWTLKLVPYFDPLPPDKIADKFNIQKSYQKDASTIDSQTWNRFLFISSVQYLRDKLNSGITHPRRLLQALGGPIQWITFIAALWCLVLLLFLRMPWSKLQTDLAVNNHLPWDNIENEVWNIKTPYYGRLDKEENYPGMFTVVRLIKDVLNISDSDKSISIYQAIRERVEAYRNSVDVGEYEIINFLIWATPTFGFIGTIFGIISAMENAAAIFAASTPIEQAIALDEVSVALGTAFDTSFIALIWLVPMSFFLARARKSEANFFEELEYEAIGNLPPQIER